jgi:hypothetical protein
MSFKKLTLENFRNTGIPKFQITLLENYIRTHDIDDWEDLDAITLNDLLRFLDTQLSGKKDNIIATRAGAMIKGIFERYNKLNY